MRATDHGSHAARPVMLELTSQSRPAGSVGKTLTSRGLTDDEQKRYSCPSARTQSSPWANMMLAVHIHTSGQEARQPDCISTWVQEHHLGMSCCLLCSSCSRPSFMQLLLLLGPAPSPQHGQQAGSLHIQSSHGSRAMDLQHACTAKNATAAPKVCHSGSDINQSAQATSRCKQKVHRQQKHATGTKLRGMTMALQGIHLALEKPIGLLPAREYEPQLPALLQAPGPVACPPLPWSSQPAPAQQSLLKPGAVRSGSCELPMQHSLACLQAAKTGACDEVPGSGQACAAPLKPALPRPYGQPPLSRPSAAS